MRGSHGLVEDVGTAEVCNLVPQSRVMLLYGLLGVLVVTLEYKLEQEQKLQTKAVVGHVIWSLLTYAYLAIGVVKMEGIRRMDFAPAKTVIPVDAARWVGNYFV